MGTLLGASQLEPDHQSLSLSSGENSTLHVRIYSSVYIILARYMRQYPRKHSTSATHQSAGFRDQGLAFTSGTLDASNITQIVLIGVA